MSKYFIFIFILFLSFQINAQDKIKDFKITIDTSLYSIKKNTVKYQGQDFLEINVDNNRELAQIEIITIDSIGKIFVEPNNVISIIDSLHSTNGINWTGVIKFENLIDPKNPQLTFQLIKDGQIFTQTIKMLVVFNTSIQYQDQLLDVYQEEEKIIEIPSFNSFNIQTENIWYAGNEYDYKVSNLAGILTLTVKPHTLGYKQLTLNLKTIKLIRTNRNVLTNELPSITIKLFVKPNQLYYLNTDKLSIYADPNFKSSEEILLDYNSNLSLKKTYRIEDNSDAEGNLIAELIPLSIIENKSKIICRIKPYSLHKKEEGYLYIKEDGRARFICNFNIWERPQITGLSIRHEGGDWVNNNIVFPGEEVELRIEGRGLENAKVTFGELNTAIRDTLKIADDAIFYKVRIPITISSKNIPIILNKKLSSLELSIKEYQRPASLDFISVNYGKGNIALTNETLNKPVFYEDNLNEINLVFNPNKIDENGKLNGKQYLQLQVKIFNRKNDLIEIQEIDNVVICPGDNSPRKIYYNYNDCKQDAISLNDYLIHKTYQLEPFSQIEITVKQNESKYWTKGNSKKIKIILTRKINFDVQVTFPTGLLVKQLDVPGYGNLTGISTSILAQFNFYNPKMIGKLRPYNVGAGFIALNAFNFNNNANNLRDVGIVVLGSITPVRRDAKFSLPIYAGGGYLLKANSWFLVFGPGIQINF